MQPLRSAEDRPDWALTGAKERDPRFISSIYMDPAEEEVFNKKLQARYRIIEEAEVRYKEIELDDADIAIVAFGTAGRISQSAMKIAREQGIKVGMVRPISLYPFPSTRIREISDQVKAILVVEMNSGQMLEDVKLAVEGRVPVSFYGRMGGMLPLPEEVVEEVQAIQAELIGVHG